MVKAGEQRHTNQEHTRKSMQMALHSSSPAARLFHIRKHNLMAFFAQFFLAVVGNSYLYFFLSFFCRSDFILADFKRVTDTTLSFPAVDM